MVKLVKQEWSFCSLRLTRLLIHGTRTMKHDGMV